MNTFKLANLIENKYNIFKISENAKDDNVDILIKKFVKYMIIDKIGGKSHIAQMEKIINNYSSRSVPANENLAAFYTELENLYDELDTIDNGQYTTKLELFNLLESIRARIFGFAQSEGTDKFKNYHDKWYHLVRIILHSEVQRLNAEGVSDRNHIRSAYSIFKHMAEYLSRLNTTIQEQIYDNDKNLNILGNSLKPVEYYHLPKDVRYHLTENERYEAVRLFNPIIGMPPEKIDELWDKYLNKDSKEKIRRVYNAYYGPHAPIEGTQAAREELRKGGILGYEIEVPVEYIKNIDGKTRHRKVITKINVDLLLEVRRQVLEKMKYFGEELLQENALDLKGLSPVQIKDLEIKRELRKDYGDESLKFLLKWQKLNDNIKLDLNYDLFIELCLLSNNDYQFIIEKIQKNTEDFSKLIDLSKSIGSKNAIKEILKDNIEEDVASEERVANINKRIGLLMKLSGLRG